MGHVPRYGGRTLAGRAAEWRLGSASTYAHITALLSRADQRALAAVYGLAALVSLFIAREEISWGQRVLGFATPAGTSGWSSSHYWRARR